MDGTLTPARMPIEGHVLKALDSLYNTDVHAIGIVSGSPYEYIIQQIAPALEIFPKKTLIMPCNGTQLLLWNESAHKYEVNYEIDMKQYLKKCVSEDAYSMLIKFILELQIEFINKNPEFLGLTGQFISYRKSMINWSPVGREAQTLQRRQFVELDMKKCARISLRKKLQERLDTSGIDCIDLKLGGSTSIDIHPTGWDKTHALVHWEDSAVWFVGDKCQPEGNDYTLWAALSESGRSFSVSNPSETVEIIKQTIIPGIQGA